MHKKMTALLVAGALSLGGVSVAQAQKVGYLDWARLTSEAPQIREAQQTVQNEFQPKFKALEAQFKDFEARVQKYQRDQATMAEAEKAKTERELRDTEVSLSRKKKDLEDEGNLRQQELFHSVQQVVQAEIDKVAKAQGFDLVVRDAAYHTDGIDVTQQVLNSLQAKAGAAAPAKPSGK